MSKNKYIVLFRSGASSGEGPQETPSPEDMQKMFAAFKAWQANFKDAIQDMGDKLGSGGRVLTASGVSDGPFMELKEVVGGYMIVSADDYAGAVEIMEAMPKAPNFKGSFEIRELAGASM